MFTLHNIKKTDGKKKKRVGRGNASGHGTYSTRGIKGQRARSGGRKGLKLKGFKQVLTSIPKKRGFKNFRVKPEVININDINDNFSDGEKINAEILFKKKIIEKRGVKIKILSKGELKLKKLQIENCQMSENARKKIEGMEGKVID